MRTIGLLTLLASLVAAADKPKPPAAAGGENDRIEIQAVALTDKAAATAEIGAELPEGILAVRVRIVPHGEEPVSVGRDDFTLVSHKDGQRAGPFAPSQIAGSSVMVVTQKRIEGGDMMTQNRGPVWGGAPGTMGRPRQMPGSGGGIGNTASTTGAEATITKDTRKGEANPLLAVLEAKTLPDTKELREAVTAYLFFPLEGKHKPKDLELIYKGPAGRLLMPFRQ